MESNNSPKVISEIITRRLQCLVMGGFGIMLLLMTVMAGLAYYNISSMESSFSYVLDENNVASRHTYRMGSIARERSIILNRIMNETDPFIRDEDIIHYGELAGEFIEHRMVLENLIKTTKGKQLLQQMVKAIKKSQPLHESVVALVNNNQLTEALKQIPNALKQQQKVIDAIERIAVYQQQRNLQISNKVLHDIDNSYSIVIGIMFLFMVIGGVTTIFVVKMNTQQHHELINVNNVLDESKKSLEEATKTATRANQIKSDFIANMSHELRTPMTSIKGSIGMLNSGMFPQIEDEVLNLINIADENADRLMSLITDVLDFSKIEAGEIELVEREVNVRQYVERMILPFKLRAERHNIELRVNIEENFPQSILADFEYVSKVLSQLLDNAFKFTEDGSISLDIRQIPDEHLMYFEVTDNGPGIEPQEKENLFETFVQGDGSSTRKHGGTGLGLSICKKILVAMNGEIGVESSQGKGSRFWFNIPLKIASQAA